MKRVRQSEMRREGRKVVGIVVHVTAIAHLCRPTVAAAIVGYDVMVSAVASG